jgi:uncharacterized membrane protein YbhN (UPF0104 family)
MDAVGPSPDLRISLEPRAIARRLAIPAAFAVVVAGVLVVADGPLQAFADALQRAVDADPRWVLAAVGFELASFAGYIALLWLIAGRASRRMDLRASAQVTLAGAGVTRLLPTAGVGGAALTLWALRRSGMDTPRAARTLFAFLVTLYSVFLVSIAVSGGLIATGIVATDGPAAVAATPAALAALACLASLWLAWRGDAETALRSGRLGALLSGGRLVGGGLRDELSLLRRPDPRLLGALAWWAFDAAVLWAMLHAFGEPPSLAVVALAYFVGQAGNTVPIPGAVSGGIVGLLVAFGVGADVALVSVLAYRSVAIWLPAGIGIATLPALRGTLRRWNEPEPEPVAPVAPLVQLVPPAPACTVPATRAPIAA